MKVFFGTGNAKKLKEIREILGDRFEIRSFVDLHEVPEVEETALTLQGNAEIKADAFFALTGLPCFADDTGLEVDALDGAPGVFSARYAGPEGDAQANMARLLRELGDTQNRSARFRTVICYTNGQDKRFFEGALEGSILDAQRGAGGFGYDPVFLPEGEARSLAEMSADEKNAISHRGRAVRAFADYLKDQA